MALYLFVLHIHNELLVALALAVPHPLFFMSPPLYTIYSKCANYSSATVHHRHIQSMCIYMLNNVCHENRRDLLVVVVLRGYPSCSQSVIQPVSGIK